jgi:hypothetical protein
MEPTNRRFFTSEVLRKAFSLASEIKGAYKEGQHSSDYFESFESCYPLISEYAYFIDDEVKTLELDTHGMNSKEITQQVYELNQKRQPRK